MSAFGLSRNFNLSTGFSSSEALANSVSAPNQTILQAALRISMKPVAPPPAVDATKPGAVVAAQAGQKACAAAGDQNARTLAAAGEGIKAMQREIASACKANGSSAGAVFPNTQGPQSVAEIGLDAASMAAGAGAGSMVTFQASSAVSTVGNVLADRSSSPEAMMAQVADTLRAANHQVDSFGLIGNADAPTGMDASQFDWNAILAAGDLRDIMYCDPNNPQSIGRAFPELLALHDANAQISAASMQMVAIEQRAFEPPYCAAGVAVVGELANGGMVVAAGQSGAFDTVAVIDLAEIARVAGDQFGVNNEAGLQAMAANFSTAV